MTKLPPPIVEFIATFLKQCKNHNIKLVVLRNYEHFPEEISRDIDFCIIDNFDLAYDLFLKLCCQYDFTVEKVFKKYRYVKFVITHKSYARFLQIDFFNGESVWGVDLLDHDITQEYAVPYNDHWITSPEAEMRSRLFKFHTEFPSKGKNIRKIKELLVEYDLKYQRHINIEAKKDNIINRFYAIIYKLNIVIKRLKSAPMKSMQHLTRYFSYTIENIKNPPGKFVVFIGHDGSGKTTLIKNVILQSVPELFNSYEYYHNNFTKRHQKISQNHELESETKCGAKATLGVDVVHKRVSILRAGLHLPYYAFRNLLYLFKIIHGRWRNKIIILDRYYYDYYFQKNYVDLPKWYIRFFQYLTPKPDHTIFISVKENIAYARKPEITKAEMIRQKKAIYNNSKFFPNFVELDNNSNMESTLSKFYEILRDTDD